MVVYIAPAMKHVIMPCRETFFRRLVSHERFLFNFEAIGVPVAFFLRSTHSNLALAEALTHYARHAWANDEHRLASAGAPPYIMAIRISRRAPMRRFLLLAGVLTVCGPVAHAAAPAVPVLIATATAEQVPLLREGLGTVQALNTATIRVQVSGLLDRVDFTEGQFLKKGQEIAQIDPRPYQAQLDQAIATRARDQANLAISRKNLNRTTPLASQGYATTQQLETQTSTLDQAQSTLKIDDALIDAARTQLSFASISAPFDGVTGLRLIDVGNVVHPNDPSGLVILTQVQPIAVLLSLPSADIPDLQAAFERGEVPAVAYASDDKTEIDRGKLLLINNQADPTTGTVQLKAEFPNAHRKLWPGTFVNVHVVVNVQKDGIVVPLGAVQQGPSGTYVFVVDPDSTAHMRPVKTGQSRDAKVLITSGLKAGERVVTDGQYGLTDGAKVAEATGQAAQSVQSTTTGSAGMLP